MALCDICTRFTGREWKIIPNSEIGEVIEHHKSYSDLCEAANHGCKLCIMLTKVLEYWMNSEGARSRTGEWANWTPEKEQFLDIERLGLSFVFIIRQDNGYDTDGRTRIKSIGYKFSSKSERNELQNMQHPQYFYDSIKFSLSAPYSFPSQTLYYRLRGKSPNLSLAKKWLDECMSSHPECVQGELGRNPTRLLHVQDSDRIQLLELPRNSKLLHYVALSHCWGKHRPLMLTAKNYLAHKEGIAFSCLPKSFQDAVAVTQYLGSEYLWIDSLCIVQDSQEDWERECSSMAEVYAHAIITISASDASDSSIGFLHDYQASVLDDFQFQFDYRNAVENQNYSVIMANTGSIFLESIPADSTLLSKRGWALQERHLSRRILSFTRSHLVWECSSECELDAITAPVQPVCDNNDLWTYKLSGYDLCDKETAKYKWLRIVEEFTGRDLTYEMDKLPALSGLAKTFSAVNLGPYMAGLWKESLPGSLLWGVRECEGSLDQILDNIPMLLGPSWSWASVHGCSIYFEPSWNRSDVNLLNVQTTIKGCDPFGRVEHGVIRLEGRLQSFRIKYNSSPNSSLETFDIIDPQNRACGTLDIDRREEFQHLRESCSTADIIVILMQFCDIRSYPWIGIALQEVTQRSRQKCIQGTFKRIGLVTGLDSTLESDNYRYGPTLFEGCEQKKIEII